MKSVLCYVVITVYMGFCFYLAFFIAANFTSEMNNAILISFIIQLVQDIVINQTLKVLLSFLVILTIGKYNCGIYKTIMLKILDESIIEASMKK